MYEVGQRFKHLDGYVYEITKIYNSSFEHIIFLESNVGRLIAVPSSQKRAFFKNTEEISGREHIQEISKEYNI